MLRNSIKQLVAENRTEEVIKALLKLSDKIKDEETKNSIVILSSRYERFVDQTIRGISDMEEQNIYLAQLNDAALKLIDGLPEAYFAEMPSPRVAATSTEGFDVHLSKTIQIAIVVLLLFSVVAFLGSMIYYIYYYMKGEGKGDGVGLGDLPLLWISLTGFAASAFFHIANRMVK